MVMIVRNYTCLTDTYCRLTYWLCRNSLSPIRRCPIWGATFKLHCLHSNHFQSTTHCWVPAPLSQGGDSGSDKFLCAPSLGNVEADLGRWWEGFHHQKCQWHKWECTRALCQEAGRPGQDSKSLSNSQISHRRKVLNQREQGLHS